MPVGAPKNKLRPAPGSWEILEDGLLDQAAFGAGAVIGTVKILEQGLPFKEQLKDGYRLLKSPQAYFAQKQATSAKLRATVQSAVADPKGFLHRLVRDAKVFLARKTVSFLKASPIERSEALGEMAPSLALAVLSPDLEGVQGSTIPYGLGSVRTFKKVSKIIRAASQDEEALVGIRGSAATGIRFKGGNFGHESDFDYFVVSDKLYREGLQQGVKARKGAFYIWDTERVSSRMHAVEERLKNQLARKSKIRIFSHNGFNQFFKTGKEIMQP